jgi:hypothetical protein
MAKQKLNSLDRFRKQSPNLVLEQASHCEVPAGCGGVVIRWRNPHAARPLMVRVYTTAESSYWLDGEPLERGSLDVAPGRHVLAVAIEETDRSALLMAALVYDSKRVSNQGPPGIQEPVLNILSAPDGTWKATFEPPAEGWQALTFDDAGWLALDGCTIPEVDYRAPRGWQWHACDHVGASGLGAAALPAGLGRRGPAWVRKVFDVPAPTP